MQDIYVVLKTIMYFSLLFLLYSFQDDEWGNVKIKNVSTATCCFGLLAPAKRVSERVRLC